MKKEMVSRIAKAVKQEIRMECEIHSTEVKKNNRLVLQALEIWEPGETICPLIYIDSLLKKIEAGVIGIQEAAREIVRIHMEQRKHGEYGDMDLGFDKRKILAGVTYQLINREMNRERLRSMPYRKFFDLAAVYRVIIREDKSGTASFIVKDALCEKFGISRDELDFAARKNTKEKGFRVMTIAEIIAETTGIPIKETQDECLPMYVLTNSSRNNGAAVMLYGEYFRELAGKLESDLYVMPSSIHEVIAVPASGFEMDDLRKMVAEVNAIRVAPEEILGGNIYKYEIASGKLGIV